jgi:syntaxin 5
LDQAKQAESTLAELGTLFGKMTHLISAQGEQLEKLEDDVEAAMGDVTAGQEEIQTLYSIKKGNRALIIKVFAILIFFILFMRLY